MLWADHGVVAVNPTPSTVLRGRVLRHETYGFFVDVGLGEEGLVPLIAVVDGDPPGGGVVFPPVGAVLEMAFLGLSGMQPRLSARPSDVAAARRPVDRHRPPL